jgi:hypothetical protein
MQKYFEKIIERLKEQKEKSAYITDGIANRRIYDNGIKNAIEIVSNVAEECKDRIFINGQCCWQSCACTEKCQECNRYTLSDSDIDWYESIEDWNEEFGKDTNDRSNDGWIPCSSNQKPKEGRFYNVTIFDGEDYRTEPAYYARIGYFGQKNIKAQWWTDCTSNAELIEEDNDKVIAWQSLPSPYKPKGENNYV